MQNQKNTFFDAYLQLRNTIDAKIKQLEMEHQKHMKCKSGCDLCCMDYGLLPLEFHFVLNELKKQTNTLATPDDKGSSTCVFLKNHVCSIYKHRPIICRSHGLPLVFMNDNEEWELSACELNFTNFSFEDFTLDNTFQQDKYNSKLFILNKQFIASYHQTKYGEFELIPIKNLLKHL